MFYKISYQADIREYVKSTTKGAIKSTRRDWLCDAELKPSG